MKKNVLEKKNSYYSKFLSQNNSE